MCRVEKNLSDLLVYSPKFEIPLDNSEPLCMSSRMVPGRLHQNIMHFLWAYIAYKSLVFISKKHIMDLAENNTNKN